MKHIILCLFMISLVSCGTSKTVRESKKVIKGEWLLDTIKYNQTGTFKVTLLNDASKECFEGSSWQFIPNNNSGVYTISNANCIDGDRPFIFTIDEVDPESGLYDFLLKPTDNKHKSETNHGFRLKLTQLSETNMQWQQAIDMDGTVFKINMNFTKE